MLYLDNKIVLLPGDFYFGPVEQYQYIQTLLGSCVAMTLWHPVNKVGGMCHFVIPRDVQREIQTRPDSAVLNGRYGDQAIKLFQQNIAVHRASIHEYQLGIYGAMKALKMNDEDSMGWVSQMNLEFAQDEIKANKWVISHRYTGGSGALRILMNLTDGRVGFSTVADRDSSK